MIDNNHGLEPGLLKTMTRDQYFTTKDISCEGQMYSTKIRDCRSLNLTMTKYGLAPSSLLTMTNEMVYIPKQPMHDLLQVKNELGTWVYYFKYLIKEFN